MQALRFLSNSASASHLQAASLSSYLLINIIMTHTAAEMGVSRCFFSSSVCVYRDVQPGEPEMTEDGAIPANPDNSTEQAYIGWIKRHI